MKFQRVALLLFHNGLQRGLLFLCIILLGYLLLRTDSIRVFLDKSVASFIAEQVKWILTCTGLDAASYGRMIKGGGFIAHVRYSCIGVYETVVFIAATIVLPTPFKNKTIGVIGGILVLYALNLMRIVAVFLVGIYFPKAFHMVHENVAQSVFIVLFVGLWLLYVQKPKVS